MRVRLKTLSAGPGGVVQPGTVIDLPQADAVALLASGSAVAVDVPKVEQPSETRASSKPAKRGKKAK